MRTARYLLFCAALLSSAALGQELNPQLISKAPRAVAIDGLPESGYYVLSAENMIYRYKVTRSGLEITGQFALQPAGEGIDLTFAPADRESVIVSQWSEKSGGSIYRYTPEGGVMAVWKTRHMPGGIHFDPNRQQLYLATLDSNELYILDLKQKDAQPQLLCTVHGALRLGPIDVDASRQLIYVTDLEGKLFAVEMGSKKVVQLSPSFGLASALLFHRGVLYLADRVQKKIFAIDLAGQKSRVIAESAEMKNPSGLAPGPGDTLLISDDKPGSIFKARLDVPPPVTTVPRKKARARPR